MAQALLDKHKFKLNQNNSTNFEEYIFHLNHNKKIRLYYSTVFKKKVLAFCLSSSKQFIITKESWLALQSLFPAIDSYLNYDG